MSFEALDYMFGEISQSRTQKDNVKKLKRNLIGFFRSSGVVDESKLVSALINSGVVGSLDEAKKFAESPSRYDLSFPDGGDPIMGYGTAHLGIKNIGDRKYHIEAFTTIGKF